MRRSQAGISPLQFLRVLRHLPHFAKLYWRLFTDRRVSLRAKALLLAGVLYVLSPVDLLPFVLFPFLGAVDDLAVFILAARGFISLCPPDMVQERVREISDE